MFVSVACLTIPRFELLVALGDRREMLHGPVALAPEHGKTGLGAVSAAAEAFAVQSGLPIGEAFARCPKLTLLTPDPAGAQHEWEQLLQRLEQIGARVEPGSPGVAYFDPDGLRGLYGGGLEGVLQKARLAAGRAVRVGVAPTRFCAWVAARMSRLRRAKLIDSDQRRRDFLGPLPVGLLRARPELEHVVSALERLGITTLGELAAMHRDHLLERFGAVGMLARDLVHGKEDPLVTRSVVERVSERIELHESAGAGQLERALELLTEQLLTRPERAGRTLAALTLSARFIEGGSWVDGVTLREPTVDPKTITLVLNSRIALLPEPAGELRLTVAQYGPPDHSTAQLFGKNSSQQQVQRLKQAMAQARSASGMPNAVARIVRLDSGSRLPEWRTTLAPGPPQKGSSPLARPLPVTPRLSNNIPIALPRKARCRHRGVHRADPAASQPGAAQQYVPVEHQREHWVVEDRWWTDCPVRRSYFELVLEDGRDAVVFKDLNTGHWYEQRA